jgi:hypothetical protein
MLATLKGRQYVRYTVATSYTSLRMQSSGMWRRVTLASTDVSEERNACIRKKRFRVLGTIALTTSFVSLRRFLQEQRGETS